ncbi:cobalt-precorrin-5B (C(1))-methyltransferase CbiD [Synechococcus sp. H60.1]|uniref:cobalt-precorrin-5B (C(1))-methyltransferase CbiD n=1 Tax=Synechococcus sp. H60.1 TaxID=2964517 RepID=UPI0039C2321C
MQDAVLPSPQQGYTLPVFAVAAAKAAFHRLIGIALEQNGAHPVIAVQVEPETGSAAGWVRIPVEQVAALSENTALAITRSDPGPHLDLTRNTPVWAWVSLEERDPTALPLLLEAGEGLGRHADGSPAIYAYARRLFEINLLSGIPEGYRLRVRIILPEGKLLAERTSNAAFGVLEGLALLGTRAEVEPSAGAESLERARCELQQKLEKHRHLAFCVGSHGQQVALRQGIPAEEILLVANWIGPLLVEAGLRGAESVHLIGYHGKLIKLAGGIFTTSSHVADARLEILVAALIRCGGTAEQARRVLELRTVEAAVQYLKELGWAEPVLQELTRQIRQRATAYVQKYAARSLPVQVTLFDRQGQVCAQVGISSPSP